jgi:hypothetical protein
LPHAGIAEALRCEIIEREYLLQASLARMTAASALASHPQIDVKSAMQGAHSRFTSALGAIPYFGTRDEETGGAKQEELEEAAQRYHQYRENALKQSVRDE